MSLFGEALNFGMQWQNLQYQKDLQERIFQREDNSVQRRAADLEAAGLSKTLAAGAGAGAGQVIQTKAPQVSPQAGALNEIATVLSVLNAVGQNKVLDGQAAKLQAETDAVRGAEARAGELHGFNVSKAGAESQYAVASLNDRLQSAAAAASSASTQARIALLDEEIRGHQVISSEAVEYLRELEANIRSYWLHGADYLDLKDAQGNVVGRLDLNSYRNRDALDLAIKELELWSLENDKRIQAKMGLPSSNVGTGSLLTGALSNAQDAARGGLSVATAIWKRILESVPDSLKGAVRDAMERFR